MRVRTVTVDVRESLWEAMVFRLNMSSQPGLRSGAVRRVHGLHDGRPMNGCTVLAARLGRGQQILT